jgi:hypothetical protein
VLNYLKSDLKIGAVGIKMIMAIELSSSRNFPIMVSMFKMENYWTEGAEFKKQQFFQGMK